jgi:hypothetical protein
VKVLPIALAGLGSLFVTGALFAVRRRQTRR